MWQYTASLEFRVGNFFILEVKGLVGQHRETLSQANSQEIWKEF